VLVATVSKRRWNGNGHDATRRAARLALGERLERRARRWIAVTGAADASGSKVDCTRKLRGVKVLGVLLRILGVGALVAGGLLVTLVAVAATVLLGPLVFWIAWNVLDFGHALGLPELGFLAILLATLFLVVGWGGKVVITGIVFLIEPSWLHGAAQVHWPAPTFRNFVAVALLAVLASRPHAHRHEARRRRDKERHDTATG
jgi:hypothetical protein